MRTAGSFPRLISRNTVEENILKKANQKRLLGDLTIDGGSFDVSYFKKNNIRDLFDQSATLEDIVRERNSYQQQMDTARTTTAAAIANVENSNLTLTQYEEALATVEDETDRDAAVELNKEVNAELNEFNEEETNDMNEDQLIEKQKRQMNKVEEELKTLDEQVSSTLLFLFASCERLLSRLASSDRAICFALRGGLPSGTSDHSSRSEHLPRRGADSQRLGTDAIEVDERGRRETNGAGRRRNDVHLRAGQRATNQIQLHLLRCTEQPGGQRTRAA